MLIRIVPSSALFSVRAVAPLLSRGLANGPQKGGKANQQGRGRSPSRGARAAKAPAKAAPKPIVKAAVAAKPNPKPEVAVPPAAPQPSEKVAKSSPKKRLLPSVSAFGSNRRPIVAGKIRPPNLYGPAGEAALSLLDKALAEKADLNKIVEEFAAFTEFFRNASRLRTLTSNPKLPVDTKVKAFDKVFQDLKLSPLVQKSVIGLLTSKEGFFRLKDVRVYLEQLVRDERNEIVCSVRVADPLTPEQMEALAKRIQAVAGKKTPILSVEVDPTILGGLVARIGSNVQDHSVASKLRFLERAYTAL